MAKGSRKRKLVEGEVPAVKPEQEKEAEEISKSNFVTIMAKSTVSHFEIAVPNKVEKKGVPIWTCPYCSNEQDEMHSNDPTTCYCDKCGRAYEAERNKHIVEG